MRHVAVWIMIPLLSACAVPGPYVMPAAAGKPPSEVSKLIAGSEARLFPCTIFELTGNNVAPLGGRRSEVTVAPGRYDVTLDCTSGYHAFKPKVVVNAQAGKGYRITGFLVDDSITVFTMRMRVKVEEVAL